MAGKILFTKKINHIADQFDTRIMSFSIQSTSHKSSFGHEFPVREIYFPIGDDEDSRNIKSLFMTDETHDGFRLAHVYVSDYEFQVFKQEFPFFAMTSANSQYLFGDIAKMFIVNMLLGKDKKYFG